MEVVRSERGADPWRGSLRAGGRRERAVVRQAELQRPHRAPAEPPVEPLDDQPSRRIDLIAPAVVLHQEMQRAARQARGLCARGQLGPYRVRPDRGGHMAIQATGQPMPMESPLQDALHRLGPLAGKEMSRSLAQTLLRSKTSWSAGISSSRR